MKTQHLLLSALFSISAIGFAGSVHAQGHQYFICNGTAQAGPCTGGSSGGGNGGNTRNGQPITYWNFTWGAIAYDKDLRIAGGSSGKGGKWSAKSAAKKDCKARGGKKCKVLQEYNSDNGCAGLSVGNSGRWATDFGNTQEEAGLASKNYCESDGKGACQVIYAGCSHLERDRVVY
ncbi:protein of unknown function [Acinetobacter marinus]|uniref:DUF4189 domain-containing protein n=1 Tax=Acinetobacter marinus TaxID=281375 RepID=A0A1G6IGJ2_9GAMM|nr:DUF4189 domain-containing protein [Acinetobacter marinus]SDC05513.1 protein of unknown function [Acinetobacter marinus]